jgi:RNA polymerase sigma-70 factor, ECF subfamily
MTLDTNKFIELLEPNYNDAVRYCRSLCNRSPDDAEDVLQQSLLQALEKFDTLKDEGKFKSWLFTIITRVFYSSIRRNFWKKFLPLDLRPGMIEIPEIYNRMENLDSKSVLRSALAKISAKERAALLLFELAEFSLEEIKDIQEEKSLSAVKSRLSRARKKLKKYIIDAEFKTSRNNKNSNISDEIEDIENETIKLTAQYKSGK